MARNMIAYGQLANGNYGTLLDPTTGDPLTSVAEVLPVLPSVASADNFDGRLVFDTSGAVLYVFSTTPSARWVALEGIPATVGNVAGNPPTTPTPQSGSLFYDVDTRVLFVWDGTAWIAVGGAFAAQVVENQFIGDGVTTTYPSGASTTVLSQYVEVFIDGVRQYAGTNYNVVGTSVQFVIAPPNAVVVLIRTTVSAEVAQNAQITSAVSVALPGQTDFSTGLTASDPAGVFVSVNGTFQTLGVDYALLQQDTTIVSFTKTSPTNARITTTVAHGIPVGGAVTFTGFNESEYNNLTFTVTNVPTTTTFDISVLASDPASGTGNPQMLYSPAFINDIVQFVAPLAGGENVDIRSLRNVVVSGQVGEANVLASTGTGVPLNTTKVGDTLQLKSLTAGPNVGIVDNGVDVIISANNGLTFEDRVGINAVNYVPTVESYVGVRNTSAPVVIDLSAITQGPINSGRRITIMDESGGAGLNNITISAAPARIDGSASPYLITNNFGAVSMVMDGTNWFVISTKP